MALAPGTRLGPYEVTGELGAGGMGVVYAATDTTLQRNVAIKVPEADEQASGKLLQEARSASALSHPNVAQIHDCTLFRS